MEAQESNVSADAVGSGTKRRAVRESWTAAQVRRDGESFDELTARLDLAVDRAMNHDAYTDSKPWTRVFCRPSDYRAHAMEHARIWCCSCWRRIDLSHPPLPWAAVVRISHNILTDMKLHDAYHYNGALHSS